MEVTQATREFRYNGIPLQDPGAQYTIAQVREFYATLYPEIINADIEGPENVGAKVVYTFRRAVGTKGGDRDTTARAMRMIDREAARQAMGPRGRATRQLHQAIEEATRPINDRLHDELRDPFLPAAKVLAPLP